MFNFRVKKLEFDADRVMRAVEEAGARAMRKAGAFIRTSARSSIRKRKRVSEPGKPPSSHVGHLKRLIVFDYDRYANSLIVGPMLFTGAKKERVLPEDTVPHTLEYGGKATKLAPGGLGKMFGNRRRIHIKSRPFMQPAFEKGLKDLAQQWEGTVR